MNKKQVVSGAKVIPVGVKVVSVFFYLIAAFLILGGGLPVIESLIGREIISGEPVGPTARSLGLGFGIIALIPGILSFLVARGLWKGVKWARIAAIILAGLQTLFLLLLFGTLITAGIITYVAPTVIGVAIIGYLLFSQSAKAAFRK